MSCDCCGGLGWVDCGDCQMGVTKTCPRCQGDGMEPQELAEEVIDLENV